MDEYLNTEFGDGIDEQPIYTTHPTPVGPPKPSWRKKIAAIALGGLAMAILYNVHPVVGAARPWAMPQPKHEQAAPKKARILNVVTYEDGSVRAYVEMPAKPKFNLPATIVILDGCRYGGSCR